jgi:mRNA interferase MazF
MVKTIERFAIYSVNPDSAAGKKTKEEKFAVVVSPDEMNGGLAFVIIAPLTSGVKGYPTRVKVSFRDKVGEVALDSLRVVDKTQLIKKLGVVGADVRKKISATLLEMFR